MELLRKSGSRPAESRPCRRGSAVRYAAVRKVWESWVFPDGAHRYRRMQARSLSQDVGRALRRGARDGCYAMRAYLQ